MLKDKFIKKIIIVQIILFLLLSVVFSIVAIWNWSLITGFLIGAMASIIGFYVNAFTAKLMLQRKRGKKKAIVISLIKIAFQFSWYITWIVLVILIDSLAVGESFGHGGIKSLMKTVNFITFIFGMSITPISIFIAQIIKSKKEKTNG